MNSQLYVGFNFACVISAYAMLGGSLFFMPINFATKGYLAMGVLFLTGSLVTLVKTLRDERESRREHEKLERARNEKLLSEYSDPIAETA